MAASASAREGCAAYSPRAHYTPEQYRQLVDKLRQERRAWLARFPRLDPVIPAAIEV